MERIIHPSLEDIEIGLEERNFNKINKCRILFLGLAERCHDCFSLRINFLDALWIRPIEADEAIIQL
jgi:hypothetical protein